LKGDKMRKDDEVISRTPDPNDCYDYCSKCGERNTIASMKYDDDYKNPECKKCQTAR